MQPSLSGQDGLITFELCSVFVLLRTFLFQFDNSDLFASQCERRIKFLKCFLLLLIVKVKYLKSIHDFHKCLHSFKFENSCVGYISFLMKNIEK